MRLKEKKTTGSKLFACTCAMLLAGGLAQQSAGLENASFEDPLIGPVDLTGIDFSQPPEILQFTIGLQLTETTIPGWVQTGDVFGDNGGVISDTGIFSNQPVPALGIPGIAGVDGLQLGFLVVNTKADGTGRENTEDVVSIYQATGTTFAANTDYQFSLEVGESNSLPTPSDRTPLRISIGYIDDTPGLVGSEVFKAIASRDILPSTDLDISGSGVLTDFTLELLAGDLGTEFLGKSIAIQALVAIPDDLTEQELTSLEGAYNIDNARFVPEPTSLALLTAGGLLFLRRRR